MDSGRASAVQKSNFSQTCSLLSQYLKENGSFGDLSLGLNRNFEPNGTNLRLLFLFHSWRFQIEFGGTYFGKNWFVFQIKGVFLIWVLMGLVYLWK